ncbi:glycosyl transferase, group 2 family protein [Verrucomicrobiia bacterium DG1235]|nr:glycosyl transferase, group 2 family protein [Verrucomicrobiae bacterium DG1235]
MPPPASNPDSDPTTQGLSSQENVTSENPDVAVVIVSYNSEGQIEACLNTLIAQRLSIRQEIIVVDNQSQDRSAEIIREKFPQVRLFTPSENLGFAKAVNFAVKQTEANYILLLNPDTEVLEHAVDKVHSFAIANPEYGFYGGRTLKEDGTTLERSSCWGQPTLWSLFLFATGISTVFRHNSVLDPESLGSWKRDSIREVGVITGCFLLAEKKAWEAIDGFDEHFWLYGEDVDLAMRARKAGYKPVITPDAVTIHEVGQSSTAIGKMIWLHRGKVSLVKKHWQGLSRFAALLFIKTGVCLRALAYSLKGATDNQWVQGWKRRAEWQNGHPEEST